MEQNKINLDKFFAMGFSNIATGFPTIGKSTLAKFANVVEVKSEKFRRENGAYWRDAYVESIVKRANCFSEVLFLIELDEEVLFMLSHREVNFTLFYYENHPLLKELCVKKAKERGSAEEFINLIENCCEFWLERFDNFWLPFCTKIKISYNSFLTEYIKSL